MKKHDLAFASTLGVLLLIGCAPSPTPTRTPTILPTVTLTITPTITLTPTPTFTPTFSRTPIPTVALEIGATRISSIDGAPMLYVPAGDFTMGSNDGKSDEKPVHTVYLNAFWIDRFEVTNALYQKCVDARLCQPPSGTGSTLHYDNYPIHYVSWEDANKYCAWAKKSLPTEAQWEKAASWDDIKREKRVYPWGNVFDKNLLNSSEGGKGDPAAVGSYLGGASPYGVMDMAGNVWEWVADWYDATYYANSPRNNPKGPTFGLDRVLRGGSWYDNANLVRAAIRSYYTPFDRKRSNVGFRCVE